MARLDSRPDWITVVQPLICRSSESRSSLMHHLQASDVAVSDFGASNGFPASDSGAACAAHAAARIANAPNTIPTPDRISSFLHDPSRQHSMAAAGRDARD